MKKIIFFIKIKFIPLINRTFKRDKKYSRILIYYSSKYFLSGGFTDRLKGIITAYQLSKITRRKFKIIFNHPFKLTEIFDQNKINWKIDSQIEKKILSYAKYYDFIDETNPEKIKNNINNIMNDHNKVISIRINQDYSDYLSKDSNASWNDYYNHLFKLSEKSREILNQYSSEDWGKMIGVHCRFINLLEDHIEQGNKLSNKDQNILINKVFLVLDEILKNCKNCKIFLCTDSKKFIDNIKNNYTLNNQLVIIDGIPKHSEKNKIIDNDLNKIISDFFLLSECSKIISIVLDDMYPSGFPKYSAKLKNKDFQVISSTNKLII